MTTFADMGRTNSIGFLRLVSASLVIVGHSIIFGGFGNSDPITKLTNNQVATGRLPVDLFFILSGFLIAASFVRVGNWRTYVWHRFLRIYPAFWVCVTLTGLVLAPIFGDGVDPAYVVGNAPLITGVVDYIPGMFTHVPFPSVNSALWTLPWELRAYVLLAILGCMGALLKRRWIIVIAFLAFWGAFIAQIFSYAGMQTSPAVTSGLRLFSFFFAGTLFYVYRTRIPVRWQLFVTSVAIMTVATIVGTLMRSYSAGMFYAVAPIPLAYVTLYLGIRLNITKVNSVNDRSYGTYIYGTLMLNVFVYFGLHRVFTAGPSFWNWFAYLLLTLVATYAVANVSWFLIEKPAMSLKDRRLWRRSKMPASEADSAGDESRPMVGDATQ